MSDAKRPSLDVVINQLDNLSRQQSDLAAAIKTQIADVKEDVETVTKAVALLSDWRVSCEGGRNIVLMLLGAVGTLGAVVAAWLGILKLFFSGAAR
jgi:hypothetical protein